MFVFLTKFLGNAADKNLLVMRFTSKLKSLAIILRLGNLLGMLLYLCVIGMFEDQCTERFFHFL